MPVMPAFKEFNDVYATFKCYKKNREISVANVFVVFVDTFFEFPLLAVRRGGRDRLNSHNRHCFSAVKICHGVYLSVSVCVCIHIHSGPYYRSQR